MPSITGPAQIANIEADFRRELDEIEAESIGWLALDDGCYLHIGTDLCEVHIVGVAHSSMVGDNVLWIC